MLPIYIAIIFHLGTAKVIPLPPKKRHCKYRPFPNTKLFAIFQLFLPAQSGARLLDQAPKLTCGLQGKRNRKSKSILRVKHNEQNHSETELPQVYDNEDSFKYPGPSSTEGNRCAGAPAVTALPVACLLPAPDPAPGDRLIMSFLPLPYPLHLRVSAQCILDD